MSKSIGLKAGLIAITLLLSAAANESKAISILTEKLYPYGFIDKTGKQVIDLKKLRNQNYSATSFSDNRAVLTQHSGLTQYIIDETGRIRSPGFAAVKDFAEGLAGFSPLGQPKETNLIASVWRSNTITPWGFIDKEGTVKIEPIYIDAQSFSQGVAAVMSESTCCWGYIDAQGNQAIPSTFSAAEPFSEERAVVKVGDKWGVIDLKGNFIVKAEQTNQISSYHDGLAAIVDKEASEANKVDYIDRDGKLQLSVLTEKEESKSGMKLDRNNNFVVPLKKGCGGPRVTLPQTNHDFAEGLAVMKKDQKYGYIDKTGKMAIAPQFDYAWGFRDGRARVFANISGGKFSFIDKSGKLIAPYKFSTAEEFSEGFALVQNHEGGTWMFINKLGKNAFGKSFHGTKSFHQGRACVGNTLMFCFL